ncbi:MAG: hypothetical protein Unbinned3818contig1000_23 [Prokaryotic dsDNA virus sp.]|nr:MAG: hypothetical protein Unbinned3818contig1000_23 [Prokaryotic dsDNA virus sp.]|tara:strand:+ start:892 stop:1098 length:207 start_codon:yes stop_codon:yes gene_type:complete
MIKRHYFIAVEKPHNDGTGSYSYDSATLAYASWIPSPKIVYEDACEYFNKKMQHRAGDKIRIVSFNRI